MKHVLGGSLIAVVAMWSFLSIVAPMQTLAMPSSMTQVAGGNPSCAEGLLTLPVWYRGLETSDSNCTLSIDTDEGGLQDFIWIIALNVVEMLMHAVGYVAVVFIIVGGYWYLTSFGEPDRMNRAKSTIKNAIIGIVIALMSVAAINFIITYVT